MAFRFWMHLEDVKEWREEELEDFMVDLKKEVLADAITRYHTIKGLNPFLAAHSKHWVRTSNFSRKFKFQCQTEEQSRSSLLCNVYTTVLGESMWQEKLQTASEEFGCRVQQLPDMLKTVAALQQEMESDRISSTPEA